jgi:uncharacterized protein
MNRVTAREDLLTAAEALRLEEFLDGETSLCALSGFDGLITAVISGPELILPSEWLDEVLDPDRAWKTRDEAREMIELVMRWYNIRVDALLNHQDACIPIFDAVKKGKRWVVDTRRWCAGYMRGIALRWESWEPLLGSPEGAWVKVIAALAPEDCGGSVDAQRTMTPKRQETALTDVSIKIYNYWRERRPPRTVRREQPKISPNSPCPCGSGKKYKRCCGGFS